MAASGRLRIPTARLAFFVLSLLVTKCASKDPEFCNRGFQIAAKYHECWEQATFANKYPDLYEPHDEYTAQFVEDYAIHMCTVVKPAALVCLRREVSKCSNAKKLVDIADESGGACQHSHLNPFFKEHIIDHLQPIPGDSKCFEIADVSYECYRSAGEEVMKSGANMVDISHFHKVADKFFDHIWDCHIEVFKSNSAVCEHWQIPMLLALQKTAMPSLFGMKLNGYQVSKLGLETNVELTTTTPSTAECTSPAQKETFILLKVLNTKPEAGKGEVLLRVNTDEDSGQPELAVVGGTAQDQHDVDDFVQQLLDSNGRGLSLSEICKKGKEQRKKYKDLRKYLKRIQNSGKKNRGKGGGKKLDKNNMIDDILI